MFADIKETINQSAIEIACESSKLESHREREI